MATERTERTTRTTRSGRTTRGLNRVPSSRAPRRPTDERTAAQMNHEERMHRRKIKRKLFSLGTGVDKPLLVLLLVLLAGGLVMLYSASFPDGYYYEGDPYYHIKRQLIFMALGLGIMCLASAFDYHHFHTFSGLVYGIAIVMLLIVLIFGRFYRVELIAPRQGEAARWLNLGFTTIQPSEVAKFAVIVMCAHHASIYFEQMDTLWYGVLPFLWIVGIPAVLVMSENHLSGTIILLALGALLMFFGGTRIRWFVIGGAALVALLVLYVSMKDGYQQGRINIWLDPFSTELSRDDTWQTRQSLYAIGSGGLLGVGLGQSRQKYLYLPEPMNDFIFAIVCEELGMVGALLIIILFSLLIWRGMYISLNAKDRFGMLLGLGITFQIGLQAVLNICVVTNTIPNTGISLPFFSYGGTSLIMLLGEMGVLMNISRSASVDKN